MKLKSNEPFWLISDGLVNSYPSLRENINCDIVVIGGGITGSLIAHQCVKDGYDTVLIDRREIGHGSTSATTSMLQYEIDVPLYELIEKIGEEGAVASYKACATAIKTIETIVNEIKSDCGFEEKDSLYFAARKKDVSWLKKEYEARKKHGFDVKWLEKDEIEEQYTLNSSHGGILSAIGGSIDAFRFTHDLLAYNMKKGLRVYDKTDIMKFEFSKSRVKLKTEYGNNVNAKNIIFCNGFESTEIIKEKFVDLLSTYAIVGERNEDDQSHLNDTLFWNTSDPYYYLRTTADNRVLIGGCDEDFVNEEKRDKLLKKKAAKLEKYFAKLFPDYKFRTDFIWAGTFGETSDGLPYIGAHKNFPGAYFVLGFGGNGITFSVTGMEMISEFLQGKNHELEPYFKFGRKRKS